MAAIYATAYDVASRVCDLRGSSSFSGSRQALEGNSFQCPFERNVSDSNNTLRLRSQYSSSARRPLQLVTMAAMAESISTPVETAGEQSSSTVVVDGSQFIRAHLKELAAYKPIEPFEVLSARLGMDPKDIVKLDANENPYGPPPEVLEALSSMKFPHIYPDPESRRLRAALAKDSGVPAEHILVGCGADELIDLIMRCTLEPGDCIVDCPPTFTMYAFDAAVNNARVIKVPRLSDFSIDVEAVTAAVQLHRPKLLFLTSPNNPDGSLLSDEALSALLRLPVLVILDEAYVEFSQEPSRMSLACERDNLIVLRTFSKRAGLAGLRVGYGAFPLSLAQYMWRAKQPYNVSVAAEIAACAALEQEDYLQRVRDALVSEREKLIERLQSIPYLTPHPSEANFILCSVHNGRSAADIKAKLAREGVMVRHYNNPELKDYIRISVGKPEQSDLLLAALERLS